MKKLLASIVLFSCFFTLAACGTTPSQTPDKAEASKISSIPFAEDQLYAVACLGYDRIDNLAFYTENYLDNDNVPVHYVSPGEYYLIIPRYPDMALSLYRNHLDAPDPVLFYEVDNCSPFVIQCNISDIFPDVTVSLTYGTETVSFSPYISLKDGSVMVGDRGLDITPLN